MPKPAQPQPAHQTMSLSARGRLAGALSGAVLIAGLAAGCGGSSHGSAGAPAPAAITKAQFIAKANSICGSADPALSAGAAKLATLRDPAQIAAVVRSTYIPSIEAQITQIRALGTPPGAQATVTTMLKLVSADLTKLKGDPMLVNTDTFADFARVAHPYGLVACAPTS